VRPAGSARSWVRPPTPQFILAIYQSSPGPPGGPACQVRLWVRQVRWLVGQARQLHGACLPGRWWDLAVRCVDQVRSVDWACGNCLWGFVGSIVRSAYGAHRSGGWWYRHVSFVGPAHGACQVCQIGLWDMTRR
jgi:hypothetical protein